MSDYHNERDVKQAVRKLLTFHRWEWWMPANNGYGASGTHDFLAVRCGRLLTIETKFGKNTPTAQQHMFARKMRGAGAFSFMVDEHRLGALDAWLTAEGTGTLEPDDLVTRSLMKGIGD